MVLDHLLMNKKHKKTDKNVNNKKSNNKFEEINKLNKINDAFVHNKNISDKVI